MPAGAIMHDWWLALVCSATGRIVALPEALVEYRQHGANTLGAKPMGWFVGLKNMMNWREEWARGAREYRSLYRQAEGLLYHPAAAQALSGQHQSLLKEFLSIPELPLFRRLLIVRRTVLRDRPMLLRWIMIIRVVITKVNGSD